MSVLSHITLGTNDIARAARFYDAVLGALGFDRLAKPPGPRPNFGDNYYAAYVRDPDGNKLHAVCYAAE